MAHPDDRTPTNVETLLEARRFRIERRTYAEPGGRRFIRDVAVHPGAVVVLAVTADARMVMIRQFRHAVGEELWELPAGTREPGEEPIVTAARELIEETGYSAEVMRPLTTFYTSPGILSEAMYAFIATGLTQVGQNLDEGEQIVAEVVDMKEVARMMREDRIRDGKTLAALGVYFMRREASD